MKMSKSREEVRARQRAWELKQDPAKAAKRQAIYRQRHPERAKANKQRHREKNLDKVRAASAAAIAKKRKENPEKFRDSQLKAVYGITLAERNAMEQSQGGLCAICNSKPKNGRPLHIDHDHTTGQVRSLLCGHCNSMLGYASDSIFRLHAAIAYLRGHQKANEYDKTG